MCKLIEVPIEVPLQLLRVPISEHPLALISLRETIDDGNFIKVTVNHRI